MSAADDLLVELVDALAPNALLGPAVADPCEVHVHGCPITRYGMKHGPCNCGADAYGERVRSVMTKIRSHVADARKGGA